MPTICPAILGKDKDEYAAQIKKIVHVAERIQIDLTDGEFADSVTIKPEDAWWPVGFNADIHLMYEDPLPSTKILLEHHPNMIIVHAEARGDFVALSEMCRHQQVKIGLALLADTPAEKIVPALQFADHVLIFSGNLGHYGGSANLELLEKVKFFRQHNPHLEIGWDGGVDDQNISSIVASGVDVLNVGGFIQKADDAEKAFNILQRIADETGTT